MQPLKSLTITPELLRIIAELDEFKGRWQALGSLAPDRLLSGLDVRSFRSRDEQEVAGYAAAMELVFSTADHLTLTENHLQELHGVLRSTKSFCSSLASMDG